MLYQAEYLRWRIYDILGEEQERKDREEQLQKKRKLQDIIGPFGALLVIFNIWVTEGL